MKLRRKEIVKGLLSLIAATSIPIFACGGGCESLFANTEKDKGYIVTEENKSENYQASAQTTQTEYKI